MPPQTPLLLIDNVFDTTGLYPGAVLTAIAGEVTGHEAFRIADYRRERTWWQALSDGGGGGASVIVQLPAAQSVDSVWLDRGHNLAGHTVFLQGSADGVTWDIVESLNVPAAGSIGGTPVAPAMAATEEGGCWTTFATPLAARKYWLFGVNTAGFVPVVTGLLVGLKTQLLGYSTTFDEDAGGRTQVTQDSTAGYRASETTYAWRTVSLGLALIGATEYDATIRGLRDLLFAKNQPAVVFLDYATRPERGWMYQYDGAAWAMAKTRVYRSGTINLREVGQRL
jgi:hypothetical protein